MASPSNNLANSRALLDALQNEGKTAIRARDLTRSHRERLVKNGFIEEVMKGWYVPTRPHDSVGDSTSWYASFWGFCADYLNARFADEWCLNPDQSISLHAGDWSLPQALLVRSPRGGNKPISLLYGTSIFDMRLELPAKADIEITQGLRIMTLSTALIACGPSEFRARPITSRAALAMLPDASKILTGLLCGGHSKIAGRIAGACRNIGRTTIADDVLSTMRAAGYTVQESDPFADETAISFKACEVSPYVTRMRMMWATMRADVLNNFPIPPGLPTDPRAYLQRLDDIYASAALLEHQRSDNCTPHNDDNRPTLAACGYWPAFQQVKASVEKVLNKQNAGSVADADHGNWYRQLFGPSVRADILKPANLVDYRNERVLIRRSMHVAPKAQALQELIPAFFELLQTESEAAVRAVLGHFMFVYIHPYFDGNGRMGRFLMNVMLASGGYPWTVVPLNRRDLYRASLEAASVKQDIQPLTRLLGELVDSRRQASPNPTTAA